MVEGGLVGGGGPGGAADLADELEGGETDLVPGGGGFKIVEGFDVSAHNSIPVSVLGGCLSKYTLERRVMWTLQGFKYK
jgi:hypothetical protein